MIVAVVLTYAAPDGMLEDCVDSVLAADGVDRLLVVDNGDRASGRLGGRGLELLVSGSNLGFAGGMNVGIRRALALGVDAVMILNDDVVVSHDTVPLLVAALERDARLGAAQPKLLHPGEPAIVNSVGVAIGRDGAGRDVGIGEPDGDAFAEDRDIESFTGGAVLLRAEMLREVGLFDERFFLYYEDVDLALRAAAKGWRHRCVVGSVVTHRGSVSTLHEQVRSRTVYLRERNRLWILLRHRPLGDIARGFWLSARRVRWSPRRVHAAALATGLAGIPRAAVARWRAQHAQRRTVPS